MSRPSSPRAYPARLREVYCFGTRLMDALCPRAGLAAVELTLAMGVHGPKPLFVALVG